MARRSASVVSRKFLVLQSSPCASGAPMDTLAERRGRLLREVVADFDRRGVGLRTADNLSREALYRDRKPTGEGRE